MGFNSVSHPGVFRAVWSALGYLALPLSGLVRCISHSPCHRCLFQGTSNCPKCLQCVTTEHLNKCPSAVTVNEIGDFLTDQVHMFILGCVQYLRSFCWFYSLLLLDETHLICRDLHPGHLHINTCILLLHLGEIKLNEMNVTQGWDKKLWKKKTGSTHIKLEHVSFFGGGDAGPQNSMNCFIVG